MAWFSSIFEALKRLLSTKSPNQRQKSKPSMTIETVKMGKPDPVVKAKRPKLDKPKPVVKSKPPARKIPTPPQLPKTAPEKDAKLVHIFVGKPAPNPFYVIGKRNAWLDSLPGPDYRMNLEDVFAYYPRWNDPELAENDDPLKLDYHLTALTEPGTYIDIGNPKFDNHRLTFDTLCKAAKVEFADKTVIYALDGIPHFKERWAGNKTGEFFILGKDGAKAIAALKAWYKTNYE